ncbi:hypothetical protein [uncultured Bifidobacterium sp.]|uniref:variant leucine-rich repeat-containing protein n=1 Tax=uncultured Bifidobacterium sp. TaxID=165187 RepID=UPI0026334652|nr:hypothetical protein [uncultured Bifidobacterium sp.]
MVDYDLAVKAVQNPDADPVLLARIAYENPEFGANVAANARAYPGLIHWLSQFGDERARRYIRQRNLDTLPGDSHQRTAVDERKTPRHNTTHGSAGWETYPEHRPHALAHQTTAGIFPATSSDDSASLPAASQPAASQPADWKPSSATPVATNSYGFTAEQALDPNTDPMTIAQIAEYAPELRACLARNPSTYPELVEWLANLHDPHIDAALATRA